jgi:hypothetical protein
MAKVGNVSTSVPTSQDQSDKIDLLRKIEVNLNFLCEAREFIAIKKAKDL